MRNPWSVGVVSVGVVLVIPDPVGPEVTRIRAALGDPRAEGMPAHITLLPPTDVDTERLDDLRAHLARVGQGHAAMRISLAGTQTFRPVSDVVYLALGEGVQACHDLGRAVCRGPVPTPSPFPFHPHVTLAHDLQPTRLDAVQEEYATFTAEFCLSEMCLYRWEESGGWQVDSRHPLAGVLAS
ncbi:MAG TPA: 2'-5' RNA ligase family protein [Ornithinimicrobium sp.]|uniref:2'-5' RNA ligase family protein n=1 Tax=Ornithinimicrobium sp. TaxID=1977084 RepID=UPI002B45C97D|nr:2'-5' RNA ligase family protein [Ornithinimicrobium sp.]HKJ12660.1 2'-5' RNA ligase family protein [Ornithinimicrobium sp.]